jgi:tartrate dehydrogenase/decarboxylase/D-malate dehydrogenase
MRQYRIAAVPGDGIGTEVIEAGVALLRVLAEQDGGFALAIENFPWGTDYYLEHGRMMPADGLDVLQPFDAIYFGSGRRSPGAGPYIALGLAAGDLPAG